MGVWKRLAGREPARVPPRDDEAVNLTITTLIAVAMADGDCADEEGALVSKVAHALGITGERRQELARSAR